MTAFSYSVSCRCGTTARAAAPRRPTAASDSSPTSTSVKRTDRASRRPEQAEGGFRFEGELNVGEAQRLLRFVEHRPAPDVHSGIGAEAKEARLLPGVHQQRDQKPIAGRGDRCVLDGDVDRAR